MKTVVRKSSLIFLACALLGLTGYSTAQNVPGQQMSPEVREQLEQLRTSDKDEIRRRWGDLASLADKAWLHNSGSAGSSLGMDIQWITPGAAMHIAFAWCEKTSNCKMEWIV